MAFSTNCSSGNGLSSEINVTPLIDVLLLLLIIFMVIVPVLPHGLGTELPSANTGRQNEDADRPVLVQVEIKGAEARYLVDERIVSEAEVAPRLLELLERKVERRILLKADAALDFGVISKVIDAGRAAGAENVALITPESEARDR